MGFIVYKLILQGLGSACKYYLSSTHWITGNQNIDVIPTGKNMSIKMDGDGMNLYR